MKKLFIIISLAILIILSINFIRFVGGFEDISPPESAEAACIPLYKGDRTNDQLSQLERNCYTQETQGDCESAQHLDKCFWFKPL